MAAMRVTKQACHALVTLRLEAIPLREWGEHCGTGKNTEGTHQSRAEACTHLNDLRLPLEFFQLALLQFLFCCTLITTAAAGDRMNSKCWRFGCKGTCNECREHESAAGLCGLESRDGGSQHNAKKVFG